MQVKYRLADDLRAGSLQLVPSSWFSQCEIEDKLENADNAGDFTLLALPLLLGLGGSPNVMKQDVMNLGRLVLQDKREALTR